MAADTLEHPTRRVGPASASVTAVGVLVGLGCAAFAAVNVWFEVTDKFDSGSYAADADALSVANWYVVAIKLLGVAAAVLAVTEPPRFVPPSAVGAVLWAGFATTAVYVTGSLGQVIAMLTGLTGDAERLTLASAGYVLAFALAAAGFGVLAFSYARRAGLGRREVLLGACAAPLVLGSVLVALPALLRAMGLLSQ
jgi:hypothetical protein